MRSRGNTRRIVGVPCALLAIVALAWLFQLLIARVPPGGGGLKTQMMHRQSTAMQATMDGMIRGDLQRVETAANQLAAYGNTIEWYLSSAEYQKHGEVISRNALASG